jgi:hypothetical protein
MATLEDVQAVVEELRALIGKPDEVLAQRISDKPVFVAHLIALRACCDSLIESLGTEGLTVVARIIHGPSQSWEESSPDPTLPPADRK